MARTLRNTTMKVAVDVDYRSLKDVDKHLKDTANEARHYENTLNKTGKAIKDVDKQQEGLSKQYKHSKDAAESLKNQVDKGNRSLGEAEKAAEKVSAKNKKLADSNEEVGRSVERQDRKIKNHANNLSQTSNRLEKLSKKYKDTGKSINEFGREITSTFGKLTLVGGAAVGYSLKKAADFEQGMKDSEALMSVDEWEQYGNRLSKTVMKLGADTKYSSVETAQGLQELIKAGVDTQNILSGGLKDSLNLATAGELDLAKAAETMSTALNLFTNDTSLTSAKAANLLAGAANASATDVGEMSFALSQSAAVANMVSQSFESTSTALAVLAQNGLKGSDAGTSLKTMLLNLSPQTEEAAKQMEALGLAQISITNGYNYLVKRGLKPTEISYDGVVNRLKQLAVVQAGEGASSTKIRKEYDKLVKQSGLVSSAFFTQHGKAKDMKQIFGLLQTSLKGLSEEQKINALKTMFGTDAIRAATIASKAGKKGFEDMNGAMQGVTAADVAKKKMDTLKGSIEYATGSVETLATDLGTALIPTFNYAAEKVEGLSDWFNSLNKETKESIAKWGLIAVGATGAATGIGLLALAVGGAVTGYGKLLSAGAQLRKWRKGSAGEYATSAKSIDVETAALRRNTSAQLANAEARGTGGTVLTSSTKNGKEVTFLGKAGKSGLGKVGKGGLLKTGTSIGKKIPILGTLLGAGLLVAGGKENLGSNGGSLAGGAAGAAAGAALGSVIPGVGTAIGGVVGGIAGSIFGEKFGASAQKSLEKNLPKVKKSLKDGLNFEGVSKGTTSAIKAYEKLNTKASEQLNLLYYRGQKVSTKTADSLIDTYGKMANTIEKSMETKFGKTTKTLSSFIKESGLSEKEQKLILKNMDTNHKARENLVRKSQSRINRILKRAAKEKRQITEEERQEINQEQEKMRSSAVKTLSKSAKEQRTIMTMLKNESGRISAKQAANIVKQSKKAKDAAIKEAEKKYKAVIVAADTEYKDNKSITKKQYEAIKDNAEKARDAAKDAAKDMHKNVVNEAKKQAEEHVKEVDWETGQVLTKWDKFKQGLAGVWNGIAGFLNKGLKALGSDASIPTFSTNNTSYTTSAKSKVINNQGNSIASNARGTNYHPGGPSVVGEEGPELAYTPYGDARLVGSKGAEIVDLPRGTRVLTASQTSQMMSGGLKGSMPGYAKGIGNKVKNVASKAVEFGSKALDFITNPSEAIGNYIKEHSLKSDILGVGTAALSKLKDAAISYVTNKIPFFGGGVGGGSVSNKYGVYDSLFNVAKTIMSSPLGRGLIITSGHRPGDTYDHGRHNAIDLSGFGSNGGYKEVARWASRLPGVSYTIGDNTVFGRKYGDGSKPGWATGHMNHVHVSGMGGSPKKRFATGGWKNNFGQVLVGEEGPELVDLPFGSHVNNNRKTNELLNKKGETVIHFSPQITVNVETKDETTESAIERAVNKALEAAFKEMRGLFDSGVAY
ncbi:phage tail tape measure protein [Rummeliibacillus sp. TYF-LIM-RU47]|uniref:phage tail tape measure protein n=1 Tax=Rummeliibacillus sp. TYF-LIM-RU47 TaxID=2608406 RepID=UPI00123C4707|nr:phage tail tape measure protein [Rummeliibacillus sp. TYF-LIM-RU47]